VKKRGRDLRDKVEYALAWDKVRAEIESGQLGSEIEKTERQSIKSKTDEAADDARDEVWASYRFVVICDDNEKSGLKEIDLGAGHASGSESLSNRVISSMKSEGLLNESVGVGYLQRNWPPALKKKGAWPLSGLRQSFLDGSLTRLVDPDETLRAKIREFVQKGEFGLASGTPKNGAYMRIWFAEPVAPEEIAFDANTSLLISETAQELKSGGLAGHEAERKEEEGRGATPEEEVLAGDESQQQTTMTIAGDIPPEMWNRIGTKVLPKIKQAHGLKVSLEITIELKRGEAMALKKDLEQVISEMGLGGRVSITFV
jgi:hypothetical protein